MPHKKLGYLVKPDEEEQMVGIISINSTTDDSEVVITEFPMLKEISEAIYKLLEDNWHIDNIIVNCELYEHRNIHCCDKYGTCSGFFYSGTSDEIFKELNWEMTQLILLKNEIFRTKRNKDSTYKSFDGELHESNTAGITSIGKIWLIDRLVEWKLIDISGISNN